ncbi:PREDICTED: cholinephosphotransferase 1 isoform X1 [Bison bison bison]|uniref:Cholinephosphotransferase 1 n=1 Tax=Bison bison bison TaxID=43346 RepID=A0A6P3IIP8_BISBB|nr:PREDICTED: cholinephosphotransferase 1 isoform X1 [Bison bison bison]
MDGALKPVTQDGQKSCSHTVSRRPRVCRQRRPSVWLKTKALAKEENRAMHTARVRGTRYQLSRGRDFPPGSVTSGPGRRIGPYRQAPYWTYLLCALGLFIYQSLDAIDGKQARRTNSCSPLGELFDHGCDSLSTVFMAVGASIAVRLGTHPDWLFFCSFIGMFMFYCAHWQTYVSGVLRFGKVDVTEIQIALVIIFVLSTFGGATMWDYTIPILEIKLKILPVLGVVGGAIFSCSNYFHVILHGGVGKNGSTIAGTSVLSPGLHIGIIIILAIMIYKKSATNLFEKHPCLYTLMFGCVFAKVSQKLVIAHMTKSELYLQDTVFIGPGLLFLDQYFNNFVDEYIVLWIAMVISSLDMMRYFSALCLQISRHLHLSIFKTSCHQAPEQVQVLPSKSHQNNMD